MGMVKLSGKRPPGMLIIFLAGILLFMSAPSAYAQSNSLFYLSNAETDENLPVGSVIGYFFPTGIFSPKNYVITDTGDAAFFIIEDKTLKTGAIFDFESRNTYTIWITDPDSGAEEEISISILDVNEKPVIAQAAPFTVNTEEGTASVFTLNAADPDEDSLSWTLAEPPLNGTASAEGTGTSLSVGYTPNPGYSGTDSFVVQVSDGELTDTITVRITITIAPVVLQNTAPVISQGDAISVSMDEDASPLPFDLTLNADDADGDTLTWRILTPAGKGTALVSGTGYVSYTPHANQNGTDSFAVEVSDGKGGTDSITVSVNISAQNDLPAIARGDAVTVSMDEDSFPTPFELTLMADDIDGDSLIWTLAEPPLNGTASAEGTGASLPVGYTPNPGYNGTDSFVVQVSDAKGGTDSIRVTVSIGAQNDPPEIASGDSVSVSMDEDGAPTPFELTLNATDPDGDSLIWTLAEPPLNGTAIADGTGDALAVNYTPNAAYNGTDSFVVEVSDGILSDSITVSVSIADRNDPPEIIEGNEITVYMDEDGFPEPFSLLLSASDPDGDLLTWSLVLEPLHGMVIADGIGTSLPVNYMPESAYVGADTFEVQVSDGEFSDVITVHVSIRAWVEDCESVCDPSVEDCRMIYMDEDGTPAPFDLTLSASDPDDDILTWSIVLPPENGTASAEGTGYSKDIHYTPDPDYNGLDNFEVQVSDGWLTDSLMIYVCIAPRNDAPGFEAQAVKTVAQDTPYTHMIRVADPDADDDHIITAPLLPDWLDFSDNYDGTATLTGTADQTGAYEVQILAEDSHGETGTQHFTINVVAVNSEDMQTASPGQDANTGSEEDSDDTADNPPADSEQDASQTWENSVPGDIDNSGSADIGDVILALQILAGMTPDRPVFLSGDVNADGSIGADEVIYVLQLISVP